MNDVSHQNLSFHDRQQGDILDVSHLEEIKSISRMNGISEERLVIISQTCDVVQEKRTKIILAPLVQLPPHDASNARRGNQSQYIVLNSESLGDDLFVDITCLVTIDKKLLGRAKFICSGVKRNALTEIENFGKAVARRFSRFPVPNEVVPWIQPLQKLVRTNSRKSNAIKDAIDRLEDLRISADHWFGELRTIELYLVVPSDEKILETDFDPSWSEERIIGLETGSALNEMSLDGLCGLLKLNQGDISSTTRIWEQIASLLSEEIRVPNDECNPETLDAIASIRVRVFSELEFSFKQMRDSQSLDLEDLSN